MLRKLRERLTEPWYVEWQNRILARIAAGEFTEETDLSTIPDIFGVDSLDWVQFTMEIEELAEVGFEPIMDIKTVGELLWLLKAIEFWHERKKKL